MMLLLESSPKGIVCTQTAISFLKNDSVLVVICFLDAATAFKMSPNRAFTYHVILISLQGKYEKWRNVTSLEINSYSNSY